MNTIKFFSFTFMIFSVIISCGNFSNEEISFGKAAGLNKEDISFIKDLTNSRIEDFRTASDTIKGIKLSVPFDKTEILRKNLADKFRTKGYQVFIAGYFNDPNKNNILGIIKSHDQFDIIRVQKTKNNRKKHSTGDIVNKLISWNNEFKFEITRAGDFWIEALFITKPADMRAFALELTKFCPEILNDGTGKIEDVISGMNSSNSFTMIF